MISISCFLPMHCAVHSVAPISVHGKWQAYNISPKVSLLSVGEAQLFWVAPRYLPFPV